MSQCKQTVYGCDKYICLRYFPSDPFIFIFIEIQSKSRIRTKIKVNIPVKGEIRSISSSCDGLLRDNLTTYLI